MAEPTVLLSGATIAQGGKPILQNVDLRIEAGEFVYLVGKTGVGKSSLLKTLYAALPLAGGRGTVTGFDLYRTGRRQIPQLRRRLGIVFQDFNLLNDRSVGNNLDFALRATGWKRRSERRRRITEVLTAVGLADKIAALPHALSGGERQRVAFARALLNKPQLMIADEVTGNLDPDTSVEMLNLMRELADEHNTAVLFATHDYRLLDTFQARVVQCRGGQLRNV